MTNKQVLGLISLTVLLVGIFTPVVSFPIIGNVNYFQLACLSIILPRPFNSWGDGAIIIVLAIISLILIFAKRYRGLWFTGFASSGIIAFAFINLQANISQAHSELQRKLMSDSPFELSLKWLDTLSYAGAQLQWGWALLIAGAVLTIVVAAVKEERPSNL